MNEIAIKQNLAPNVWLMGIYSPQVAKKAKPGQFVILRVTENGERIPLTIADFDREKGVVYIIFQVVGKTTSLLAQLNIGDMIIDFVGPLGIPYEHSRKIMTTSLLQVDLEYQQYFQK